MSRRRSTRAARRIDRRATPRARYRFDALAWQSREQALDELMATLPLPAHCGRNLDAIADALWELPPCTIELRHALVLTPDGPLGSWGTSLRGMLVNVSVARGADLDVILSR